MVASRRLSRCLKKVYASMVSSSKVPHGQGMRRDLKIKLRKIHSSHSQLFTWLLCQLLLKQIIREHQLELVVDRKLTPKRLTTAAPSTSIQSVTIDTSSLEFGSDLTPTKIVTRRLVISFQLVWNLRSTGNWRVSPLSAPRSDLIYLIRLLILPWARKESQDT